jgi:hypothetical protein
MNAIFQRHLELFAETQADNEVRSLLAPLKAMEPNAAAGGRLADLASTIEKARWEYTKLMMDWRKECLVRSISDKVITDALNSFRATPQANAGES